MLDYFTRQLIRIQTHQMMPNFQLNSFNSGPSFMALLISIINCMIFFYFIGSLIKIEILAVNLALWQHFGQER